MKRTDFVRQHCDKCGVLLLGVWCDDTWDECSPDYLCDNCYNSLEL